MNTNPLTPIYAGLVAFFLVAIIATTYSTHKTHQRTRCILKSKSLCECPRDLDAVELAVSWVFDPAERRAYWAESDARHKRNCGGNNR